MRVVALFRGKKPRSLWGNATKGERRDFRSMKSQRGLPSNPLLARVRKILLSDEKEWEKQFKPFCGALAVMVLPKNSPLSKLVLAPNGQAVRNVIETEGVLAKEWKKNSLPQALALQQDIKRTRIKLEKVLKSIYPLVTDFRVMSQRPRLAGYWRHKIENARFQISLSLDFIEKEIEKTTDRYHAR